MWMIEALKDYFYGNSEENEGITTFRPKYTEEELKILSELSREEHSVYNKLNKHYLYSQLKFRSKIRYSQALSTPEQLKRSFLHHKFKEPQISNNEDFLERSTVDVSERFFHFNEEEDEEFVLLDPVKNIENLDETRPKYEKGMKIQLVISDIEPEKSTFSVLKQKVTTKFFQFVGKLPTFGIWHTSIIIGGVKIEWNDSALVIPRPCQASLPILCVNLVEIPSEKQYNDYIDRLSVLITDWNVHRKFDQRTSNCQTFVDEVMKELEILDSLSKIPVPLQKILRRIKNEHMDTMMVEFSEDFVSKFGIESQTFQFNTHQQLDNFVNKLMDVDPNFLVNQRDISFVLKCYDRSFWLDYLKKPKNSNTAENCPFNNPEVTLSLNGTLEKKLPKFKSKT